MDCSICHRRHDAQQLPFFCAVDARNNIYQGRMKNLQLILENETLKSQINELPSDFSTASPVALQQSLAQQHITEDRTDQILAAAENLREEIRAAREEIRARKAALAKRRSDFASVSDGLVERRVKQRRELEKSAQMLRFRWAQKAEATSNTRAFLCTEAIKLYGLKRLKKGGQGRYDYHLGKVPIIDLADMDSISPETISTSLAHVAHILMLVCHYLSVRLPAEVTLPHRDYPRPTIFNLASSYQHINPPFPSFPGISSSVSHVRGNDSQRAPRPRPLFVEKPLTQLAKEDPATYSFFLEGVTLLAYDVAWLCCSQGVSVGDTSNFDDICSMGRNLYSFLLSAQAHDFHTINVEIPGWSASGEELREEPLQGNWLGRYSHGGTFYFLGSPEGTELMRSFKLPSPMKLADKLKKKLIGDAPTPDWELLDDDAWKMEEISVRNAFGNQAANGKLVEVKSTSRTGSNGWTKLKHR